MILLRTMNFNSYKSSIQHVHKVFLRPTYAKASAGRSYIINRLKVRPYAKVIVLTIIKHELINYVPTYQFTKCVLTRFETTLNCKHNSRPTYV